MTHVPSARPSRRRRTALTAAVAGTGVLALALAGCSSSSSPSVSGSPTGAAASGKTLNVVATTTQVADLARNVAGDQVQLAQLLGPNQSAHHFDPTAADLATLAKADVLVISGAGLETWVDSVVDASGFQGTVIDTAEGITLSGEAEDEDEHADGDEHDESDEHADEHGGSAVDEELAHDEAASGNPHTWTDPNNARIMVDNIAKGLAAADPDAAATFEANASAYDAKLTELDTWITTNVDQVAPADRLVVSNHDAFHYYLDRYGITFVGSIIPSFEDNAEPSAAQIQQLVDKIKELGVKAIFSESSISDKTATSIASTAGVTVYSGDDALFGDSLGEAGSDGATYLAATVHNTKMFLESWGVTPSALPADLESSL
jgi:zinc/manganese transport system substrate-binding protein/manganese/iron transport system substrate-binding protein